MARVRNRPQDTAVQVLAAEVAACLSVAVLYAFVGVGAAGLLAAMLGAVLSRRIGLLAALPALGAPLGFLIGRSTGSFSFAGDALIVPFAAVALASVAGVLVGRTTHDFRNSKA